MSYQKVTGTLSQGAHPGSYNGQDAYNDMLVTSDELCSSSVWSVQRDGSCFRAQSKRLQGRNGLDHRGGVER